MSRETPLPPGAAPLADDEVMPALARALRQARLEAAEREQATGDVATLDRARLELLDEALDPVFRQIPAHIVFFDRAIQYGTTPRLWIDCTAYVAMTRDRRSYRLVQETRAGRHVLAENAEIAPMVEAVTTYVARRLVERERALAARPDAAALPLDEAVTTLPPATAMLAAIATQPSATAPLATVTMQPPAGAPLAPSLAAAPLATHTPAPDTPPTTTPDNRSPRPLVAAPRAARPLLSAASAASGALALRKAPETDPPGPDVAPPADSRVARFWQGVRRRSTPRRDIPAALPAPAAVPAPASVPPEAPPLPEPPAAPPAPALAADDPMRVFTATRSISFGSATVPEPARRTTLERKAAPIAGRRRPSSWRIELLLIGLLMTVLAIGVVLARLRA